jgi:hypothetical protein
MSYEPTDDRTSNFYSHLNVFQPPARVELVVKQLYVSATICRDWILRRYPGTQNGFYEGYPS